MRKCVLLFLACACGLEAGELKRLTFEQVFMSKGEALLQPLPEVTGWVDDSRYAEVRAGKIFLVDARSGHSKVLFDPAAMKKEGRPANLDWLHPDARSSDYSRLAFVHEGDIYLVQTKPAALRRLTATALEEKNPLFSPDGSRLAYTAGNNLHVCDLASGACRQLTFDGSGEILNGYASWVYFEEILGRESRYRAFDWSPDGVKIIFMRFDQSKVPRFPIVSETGAYGRLEMQYYPKPGFPNPEVKLGIIDLAGNGIDWVSFADSGEHYLTFLGWSADSAKVYIQWLNRGQDDLRLYEYGLAGKKLQQVFGETQKEWVDFLDKGSFCPLAGGGFLLLSSRSGWNHLVHVDGNGAERTVTHGDWSVSRIECVDERKGHVFFSADKEDSTRSDVYRLALGGGPVTRDERPPQRLTRLAGSHRPTFSKGGSFFLDRCSSLKHPATLQLCDRDGRVLRRLGDSAAPALAGYALGRAELFRIPAADGLPLPAAWILPPGFSAVNKYPVVMSIYGGPGARSVIDVFPRRLDGYYLAQEGIIVLRVDHRGSGHFGKKGMAAMHRCLGKWEIADYSSVAAYLRTLPFIDPGRIGITGGSYGGYVTALAMVSLPDVFSCGIAEYSVTDYSLYDSVYTERYMDLPAENPDGYRQASVLTHASTYRGGLRLIHGSMDDNVHMQNSLQLLNVILDAGKTVELMIYPGERHGVRGRKAVEKARSTIEFWRRKFFAPKEVGPVGQVRPDRQE
jgi:dipeptidyl-peptidase-4